MNPILSIGIYVLMLLLCAWLAVRCLIKNPILRRRGKTDSPSAQGANDICGEADSKKDHKRHLFRYGAAGVIYVLLGALPVAGAMLPDSSLKFALQGAGNIWLGFFVYFGGILLILSVVLAVLELCIRRWNPDIARTRETGEMQDQSRMSGADKPQDGKKAEHPGERRKVMLTGEEGLRRLFVFLCALISGIVLLLYGLVHAQHTVVTSYEVTVQKQDGSATGWKKDTAAIGLNGDLKLVLLADLHLSVNSNLPMIRKMVDRVNEQEADAVLIAGDIFTSSYRALKDPDAYAAILREMKATYGVYAVYGNHDVEGTLFGGFPISPISQAFRTKEMEQFFKDCGFRVLYDETVTIADGTVQITGRIDGEKAGDGTTNRKSPQELLSGTDPEKYSIVLEHEPAEFAALKENGADLVLAGHTHAGQIFPGNLIVPFFNENAYGYRIIDGLDTIVTSGIGYYGPPMRVGTDSEIAVIRIQSR